MRVPFKYIIRSLFARKLTSILTIIGISLVAFMFCGVLMLAAGIKKVLVSTGEPNNVMVMQKDKYSEVESSLTPEQLDLIENVDVFEYSQELGERLLAPELVVSISLPEKGGEKLKNLTLRGVVEASPMLRKNFRLIDGELYEFGLPTCIVGKVAAQKIANCTVGDSIKINNDYYQVMGIFTTGGTMYDSEIWADIFSLRDSYNRAGVAGSIVLGRLKNPEEFSDAADQLQSIPDLEIRVLKEQNYYSNQAEGTTMFLKMLGIFICAVFALGATIGAMITMYSAVANRTGEIATMRALGFTRLSILTAFLLESIIIGAIGAIIGITGAFSFSFKELQMFSTMNFFGEFYLKMTLTLMTVLLTFAFAIVMGLLGGVLPSIRASRMKIIEAFRSA
jgi:putative ABC transport system permease protein